MALTVLSSGGHRNEDFDLDMDVLPALWEMEDRHFWHAARNEWILAALAKHGAAPGARILDVGCGGGAVVRALVAAGYRVTGVDTAEPLVRKAFERCPEAEFYVGDVAALPRELREFDVISFCDVLEHLDAPENLLASACRRARTGALVLATVPAQSSLFSVVDELAGHKRRYERGELAALFARAGVESVHERGIFRMTLGVQSLLRREAAKQRAADLSREEQRALMRADVRVPSAIVNAGLRAVCHIERTLAFRWSENRVGASLLAVGTWSGER